MRDRDDKDCHANRVGKIVHWVLWYMWLILFIIVTPIVLGIGIIKSYKKSHGGNVLDVIFQRKQKASAIVLIAYVLVYLTTSLCELCIRIASDTASKYYFGPQVINAIITPIKETALPLLALLYLWHSGKFPARTEEQHHNPRIQNNAMEQHPLVKT